MASDTNTTQRNTDQQPKLSETMAVATGIPFWDMMFSFGRASQRMMSAYTPRPDFAMPADIGARHESASSVEVIPVGEETLNVGTRRIAGETTRVRRVVVETPVEQDVSLRDERVIVERRKPTGAASTATQAILADTAIEMSDSFEVVDVWKSVRVTEEVVLRREVTERHETVRDTVRHDEVRVEQARHAKPVPHSASRHEAETAQHDQKPAAPARPEPAQIAADMKKVAERFEPKAEPHDKAPAASAQKADHKPMASQPSKAAEQPKTPARPEASAAHNDKGHSGPKA